MLQQVGWITSKWQLLIAHDRTDVLAWVKQSHACIKV